MSRKEVCMYGEIDIVCKGVHYVVTHTLAYVARDVLGPTTNIEVGGNYIRLTLTDAKELSKLAQLMSMLQDIRELDE